MSPDQNDAKKASASTKDTRAKAKAAAEAARAAQARRDRTIRIVGGLAVVAVVAGIIGVGVWQNATRTSAVNQSLEPRPGAPVPKGVDETTLAVPYPGNKGGSLPKLELWEDFQCPACKALEDAHGPDVLKLADDGKANLFWRPTVFLDKRITGNNSQRATSAWGCAIDQGKTTEFHTTVFANQPTEGTGYTQDTLKKFGEDIGLSGSALSDYQGCVESGKYIGWANNSYELFGTNNIPGTPTTVVNGTKVDWDYSKPEGFAVLEQAIADAAAGKVPTSAPSGSESITPVTPEVSAPAPAPSTT